jgi:hypothetical protein
VLQLIQRFAKPVSHTPVISRFGKKRLIVVFAKTRFPKTNNMVRDCSSSSAAGGRHEEALIGFGRAHPYFLSGCLVSEGALVST